MLAVITGATKGIGRAIAEALAAEGCNLAITARGQAELLACKKEIEAFFPVKVFTKPANFSRKADVILFADYIRSLPQPPDLVINNVGAFLPGRLFDYNVEALEEQLRVNVLSAHILVSQLKDSMIRNGKGHIFNIVSVAGKYPRQDAAFYSISKHTMLAWSEMLFHEMKNTGVRVTSILPSSTHTSSWEGSGIDPGELIAPSDIAGAVINAWKMSPAAAVQEIIIRTSSGKYE